MDFQGDITGMPIYLGFATGLLAALLFGSWMRRVGAAREAQPGVFPRVAVLHPVPWAVLVALPYTAYRSVWLHPSPGAGYYYAATAITFVAWLALVALVSRRVARMTR